MRKILDNKKGDIPVTLLVIGTLVVCTLALFSFIKSDRGVKKSFSGIEIMEKANLEIEKGNLENYSDEKILNTNLGRFKVVFSVRYEREYVP